MPLALGLLLPTRGVVVNSTTYPIDVSPVIDMAVQAEQAGLDSVWVGDSLVAKPRLEPLATLAAISAKTQRVRLGTSVLLAPLRHPVALAQQAATVDLLSKGRLTLGLGVGGVFNAAQRQEWRTTGVEAGERGARMTEILQVCRGLWTGGVDFHGKHFTVDIPTYQLRPCQPTVPMLLACHLATGSNLQYRRAARYADGVIGITDAPAAYRQVLDQVGAYWGEYARQEPLRTAFYMTVNIDSAIAKAAQDADTFIRAYYGQNFWADKWGPFGPADQIAQRILDYHAAGAQELIIRFAAANQRQQLDRFLTAVLPQVRAAAHLAR